MVRTLSAAKIERALMTGEACFGCLPIPADLIPLYYARGRARLRPNPRKVKLEELIMWGSNFRAMITSEAGRYVFRQHLQQEFSEENILFYEACLRYENSMSEDEGFELAKSIWEEFISQASPTEVSLPSHIKDAIDLGMINPGQDIFNEAVDHIYQLMKDDSYPRFVNSNLYQSILEQARKDYSLNDYI